MDAALYGSFFPPLTGKQCVVYKCAVEENSDCFSKWLDEAVDGHGHLAL